MTSGSHFPRLHFRPNFLECYSQGERGRSAVKGVSPSEEPSWQTILCGPTLCSASSASPSPKVGTLRSPQLCLVLETVFQCSYGNNPFYSSPLCSLNLTKVHS